MEYRTNRCYVHLSGSSSAAYQALLATAPLFVHATALSRMVTYAGEGCIIYTWDAAGLRLSLSNIYDWQGQPHYTCKQMRKIVESVR